MALSATAPVALLYLLKASVRSGMDSLEPCILVEKLTGGNKNEGGASVDDTSGARQDVCGTVLNGLVDTPVE